MVPFSSTLCISNLVVGLILTGAEWEQGDPGPRLLQVAELLTAAASTSSSAGVAAMAASVVQGIMFTSVCRGFISADADLPEAHGTTEVQRCSIHSFLAHMLIAPNRKKNEMAFHQAGMPLHYAVPAERVLRHR